MISAQNKFNLNIVFSITVKSINYCDQKPKFYPKKAGNDLSSHFTDLESKMQDLNTQLEDSKKGRENRIFLDHLIKSFNF